MSADREYLSLLLNTNIFNFQKLKEELNLPGKFYKNHTIYRHNIHTISLLRRDFFMEICENIK